MTTEATLEILEELSSQDGTPEATKEALNRAMDAVAFSQALWTTLKDLNRVTGTSVDFTALELSLDTMNNQLSAAAIFLAGLPVDAPALLVKSADAYEKHTEDKKVGTTIAQAYRRLAHLVEGVKIVTEAKKKALRKQSVVGDLS